MTETPAMADLCVDCGAALLLCDHVITRITDPMLAFQGKVIGEFQAALAEANARADRAELVLAEMREALEALEWRPQPTMSGSVKNFCPICHGTLGAYELNERIQPGRHGFKPDGHKKTCELVALLAADPDARGTKILELAHKVVARWQAVGRCEDEFEPEDMAACGEHRDALDMTIDALRALLGPGGRGAGG